MPLGQEVWQQFIILSSSMLFQKMLFMTYYVLYIIVYISYIMIY